VSVVDPAAGANFTLTGLGSGAHSVEVVVCTENGCSRSAPVVVTPSDDASTANSQLVGSALVCAAVAFDFGSTATVAQCSAAVGASGDCGASFTWSFDTLSCVCCDPNEDPTMVAGPPGTTSAGYTSDLATLVPATPATPTVEVNGLDTITVSAGAPDGLSGGTVQNISVYVNGTLVQVSVVDPAAGANFTLTGLGSGAHSVEVVVCTENGCSRSAPVVVTPSDDASTANSQLVGSALVCAAVAFDFGSTATVAQCSAAVGASGDCGASFTWSFDTLSCVCCDPNEDPTMVAGPPGTTSAGYTSDLATLVPATPATPTVEVNGLDTITVSMVVGALNGVSIVNVTVVSDSGDDAPQQELFFASGAGPEYNVTLLGRNSSVNYTITTQVCTLLGCSQSQGTSIITANDPSTAGSTLVESGHVCLSELEQLGTFATLADCSNAVRQSSQCGASFSWQFDIQSCACCDPTAQNLTQNATGRVGSVYTSDNAIETPEAPSTPSVSPAIVNSKVQNITVVAVAPSGLNGGTVQNTSVIVNGTIVDTSLDPAATTFVVDGLSENQTFSLATEVCTQFGCALSTPVIVNTFRITAAPSALPTESSPTQGQPGTGASAAAGGGGGGGSNGAVFAVIPIILIAVVALIIGSKYRLRKNQREKRVSPTIQENAVVRLWMESGADEDDIVEASPLGHEAAIHAPQAPLDKPLLHDSVSTQDPLTAAEERLSLAEKALQEALARLKVVEDTRQDAAIPLATDAVRAAEIERNAAEEALRRLQGDLTDSFDSWLVHEESAVKEDLAAAQDKVKHAIESASGPNLTIDVTDAIAEESDVILAQAVLESAQDVDAEMQQAATEKDEIAAKLKALQEAQDALANNPIGDQAQEEERLVMQNRVKATQLRFKLAQQRHQKAARSKCAMRVARGLMVQKLKTSGNLAKQAHSEVERLEAELTTCRNAISSADKFSAEHEGLLQKEHTLETELAVAQARLDAMTLKAVAIEAEANDGSLQEEAEHNKALANDRAMEAAGALAMAQALDASVEDVQEALHEASEVVREAVKDEFEIVSELDRVAAAHSAAQDTQQADADLEAASEAARKLEEAAASKSLADRAALEKGLKATQLRLQLAQQRADRAARSQRKLRIGNTLLTRGAMAAKSRKAAEEERRRLEVRLAEEQSRLAILDPHSEDSASARQALSELQAELVVATAKVSCSEAAADEVILNSIASTSEEALIHNEDVAIEQSDKAARVLQECQEMSETFTDHGNAVVIDEQLLLAKENLQNALKDEVTARAEHDVISEARELQEESAESMKKIVAAEAEVAEAEDKAADIDAGAERAKLESAMKASRLRLKLAKQRAERAARAQRALRIGGALVKRGAVAAKAAKDAEAQRRRLQGDLDAEKRQLASSRALPQVRGVEVGLDERLVETQKMAAVAEVKAECAKAAARELLEDRLEALSESELVEQEQKAISRTVIAVGVLEECQNLEVAAVDIMEEKAGAKEVLQEAARDVLECHVDRELVRGERALKAEASAASARVIEVEKELADATVRAQVAAAKAPDDDSVAALREELMATEVRLRAAKQDADIAVEKRLQYLNESDRSKLVATRDCMRVAKTERANLALQLDTLRDEPDSPKEAVAQCTVQLKAAEERVNFIAAEVERQDIELSDNYCSIESTHEGSNEAIKAEAVGKAVEAEAARKAAEAEAARKAAEEEAAHIAAEEEVARKTAEVEAAFRTAAEAEEARKAAAEREAARLAAEAEAARLAQEAREREAAEIEAAEREAAATAAAAAHIRAEVVRAAAPLYVRIAELKSVDEVLSTADDVDSQLGRLSMAVQEVSRDVLSGSQGATAKMENLVLNEVELLTRKRVIKTHANMTAGGSHETLNVESTRLSITRELIGQAKRHKSEFMMLAKATELDSFMQQQLVRASEKIRVLEASQKEPSQRALASFASVEEARSAKVKSSERLRHLVETLEARQATAHDSESAAEATAAAIVLAQREEKSLAHYNANSEYVATLNARADAQECGLENLAAALEGAIESGAPADFIGDTAESFEAQRLANIQDSIDVAIFSGLQSASEQLTGIQQHTEEVVHRLAHGRFQSMSVQMAAENGSSMAVRQAASEHLKAETAAIAHLSVLNFVDEVYVHVVDAAGVAGPPTRLSLLEVTKPLIDSEVAAHSSAVASTRADVASLGTARLNHAVAVFELHLLIQAADGLRAKAAEADPAAAKILSSAPVENLKRWIDNYIQSSESPGLSEIVELQAALSRIEAAMCDRIPLLEAAVAEAHATIAASVRASAATKLMAALERKADTLASSPTDENMAIVSALGSVAGGLEQTANSPRSKRKGEPRGVDPNIDNPARPYSRPWSRTPPSRKAWDAAPKAVSKKRNSKPSMSGLRMPMLMANHLDGHIADAKRAYKSKRRTAVPTAKKTTSTAKFGEGTTAAKARKAAASSGTAAKSAKPAPVYTERGFDVYDNLKMPTAREPTEIDERVVQAYTLPVVPTVAQDLPPQPTKKRSDKSASKSNFKMRVPSSYGALKPPPGAHPKMAWGS